MALPFVLCLAGPTGAGKTAAALHLATALQGEVVNVDSRQVYRDFPIITAQPSAEEQSVCPHHLYGFLPTEEKLSAGRFAEQVLSVVQEITSRGKLPILVGGTGLYFKTLLEGMADIPAVDKAISEEFLHQCSLRGSVALHKELTDLDPAYAARIHPNDKQRVVRALEVHAATGKTFTWWHENAPRVPMVRGLYLATETTLDALRPRLDARIELMLKAGAMEEVHGALEICSDAKAPGWSGIGCAELYAHVCKGVPLQQSLDLWRKNTRAYAKRQLTWFRAVPQIHWFSAEDTQGMLRAAQKSLCESSL